ncbi:MAG TPA: ABC transporter permease [Solirubrobacteraceae bacterium]|jgi:ABC-2 type transport system permease protein|nr:ABC transporter permease [Solirubrobacteraceae bacterium]
MRWLLEKDLRILRRSRLLVALLVVYPVVIALLIGLALSRGPGRPRVAIVDETAPGATLQLGTQRVDVRRYTAQLFDQVQAIEVPTRAQALAEVRSADVLAAVVIPPDIVAKASSGIGQGELELIYNGDALEQSLVDSQLRSALAQANLGFSEQIQAAASQAIDQLLKGGNLGEIGAPSNLVGLAQVPALLARVIAHQPPGADRRALERVATFADFAARNLELSKRVLASVGQPIKIRSSLLHGRRTPLDTFAVVVAVSISLMFVCVLLAAGAVALEREENALPRLLRGLVSVRVLLAEKCALAGGCAFAVALAMLAGVGAFVPLHWSRFGLWLLALAVAAAAFAALGVAIGVLAREVRAASLLAFLLSLPLAFLALVPAGAVAHGLYDAIGVISFVFPFKAALQALDAAVNGAAPSIGGSLAHLAVLAAAFSALAGAALARTR